MARGSSKSSGSTRKGRSGSSRGTSQTDTQASEGAETLDSTADSVTVAAEEALSGTEEGLKDAADSLTAEDGRATRDPDDSTRTGDGTDTPEDGSAPAAGAAETVEDGSGTAGDDVIAGTQERDGDLATVTAGDDASDAVTVEGDESDADTVEGDESVTATADADDTGGSAASGSDESVSATEPPRPEPAPAPPLAPERRGGFVPLVLGGVIAAGIGYGAAYMGWLPTMGAEDGQDAAIAEALDTQSAVLADLQSRVTELSAAEPPEVDLSPVLDQVEALSARIDTTAGSIETLADRVSVLEERPVFTGNVDEDTAAAAEAAEQMEAELAAQREAAEARAAEMEAAAEDAAAAAQAAAEEAAATVAQAEAEAAEAMAQARAEAALNALRVALETGEPFAEDLAAVSAAAEVPEGLSAVAETGVPTREALRSAFPPLAREALPVALQETAGENVGDRLTAFVRGQIGGRAVEPREGDDPDAVLSRVGAAIRSGDLQTALTEITALPQGAQDVLAPWVADVEARTAAEEGLDALTTALSGSGN